MKAFAFAAAPLAALLALGALGCGDNDHQRHSRGDRWEERGERSEHYDRSRDPRYYPRSEHEREDWRRQPYGSLGNE